MIPFRILWSPSPVGEGTLGVEDDVDQDERPTEHVSEPGVVAGVENQSEEAVLATIDETNLAANLYPSQSPRGLTRIEVEELLRSRAAEHARELAEKDRRASQWEQAYRRAVGERELATALAGYPLLAGASEQLIKLWSEEFHVSDEGNSTRITTRDGRGVARAVADWLASPEYAHFCQPTSRGGTSPPGANRSVQGSPTGPGPRTLGDAVIQQWREALSARGHDAPLPIGLHRRR